MEDIKSSRVDDSFNAKVPTYDVADNDSGVIVENVDDLKRRLTSRQMQMIAIGGSIGTALLHVLGRARYKEGQVHLLSPFSFIVAFLHWLIIVRISQPPRTPFSLSRLL